MKPKTVGRVKTGQNRPEHAQDSCYGIAVGTPIMTSDGSLPVEFLTAGDRIVTRNGGMTKLEGIDAVTRLTHAVRVSSDFLGGEAEMDIMLPADQPVLVRDWRATAAFGLQQTMAAAGHLVDGVNFRDVGPRRMVLFRLSFDRPRIVYSHGLELGTEPGVNLPLRNVA
ncbi:MAG: Hint domain-containing protein [Pseudomonadota bacterium]